jgi:hypothetical protein
MIDSLCFFLVPYSSTCLPKDCFLGAGRPASGGCWLDWTILTCAVSLTLCQISHSFSGFQN